MNRTVVVGLGNPARGDAGIGLAIIECLRDTFDVPDGVLLLTSASRHLLKAIAGARRLLILDAIEGDESPGTAIRLCGVEVHQYLDLRFSPRQVQVCAALAAADLRRRLPEQLVAIGVQPKPARPGTRMSAAALQGIDHAAALAAQQLEEWGFACQSKHAHAAGVSP